MYTAPSMLNLRVVLTVSGLQNVNSFGWWSGAVKFYNVKDNANTKSSYR